jgi:hypothetical protein
MISGDVRHELEVEIMLDIKNASKKGGNTESDHHSYTERQQDGMYTLIN